MSDMWVYMVVGGVLLALIIWGVRRKMDSSTAVSVLEDEAFIEGVMHDALDRRARFDIRFEREDLKGRYMRGPCVAVASGKILIDTNLSYVVPAWVGERVEVCFNLVSSKSTLFYSFASKIAHVPSYREGYALELTMPHKLDSNQRRAFVRLTPPRSFVSELQFWVGETALSALKKTPAEMFASQVCMEHLFLDNISAGGARFSCVSADLAGCALDNGNAVLMYFDMHDGDGRGRLVLWVTGLLLNATEEDDHTTSLMIQFRSWAACGDPRQPFSWFPVNKQGAVPSMAAWVMQRHLAMHRLR